MKFFKLFTIIIICLAISGMKRFTHQPPKVSDKKRIAVFNFSDKTDRSYNWWNQKSVGEGMSDMIITELVKTNKFRVIEREELQQLINEQDLGRSGIVDSRTAARIGKVLGVEYAILGSVTEFGYKKNESRVQLGNRGVNLGIQKAIVALDLRIVNTTTGEIILAESAHNSKTVPSGGISTRKFQFNNKQNFDQSIVGKVTRKSVKELIRKIVVQAE